MYRNILPFYKHYIFVCNYKKYSGLVDYLPKSTKKKIIVFHWTKFLLISGLIRLLPLFKFSRGFIPKQFFEELRDSKCLFFSQNLELRNRYYIIRKSDSKNIDFIKVVESEKQNNFKNELSVNTLINDSENFKYICLKKLNKIDGKFYLYYNILPRDAKLVTKRPYKIYNHLYKVNEKKKLIKSVDLKFLSRTSWWKNYKKLNLIHFNQFVNDHLKSKKYKIMWCHGDLGSENIFIKKNIYYLIDWEKTSYDSPYIVDLLGIVLGNNSRIIISNKFNSKKPSDLINFYYLFFSKKYKFEDFLLGIIFYLGTDFNLAKFLISNFNYENSLR